jgi:hypothetical protein
MAIKLSLRIIQIRDWTLTIANVANIFIKNKRSVIVKAHQSIRL